MMIELEKQENQKKVLAVEVDAYDKKYVFRVRQETLIKRDGYTIRKFGCFQEGNFNFTLNYGRKSQKKLDTLNDFIKEKSNILLDMWKQGKHKDMCSLMLAFTQDKKMF